MPIRSKHQKMRSFVFRESLYEDKYIYTVYSFNRNLLQLSFSKYINLSNVFTLLQRINSTENYSNFDSIPFVKVNLNNNNLNCDDYIGCIFDSSDVMVYKTFLNEFSVRAIDKIVDAISLDGVKLKLKMHIGDFAHTYGTYKVLHIEHLLQNLFYSNNISSQARRHINFLFMYPSICRKTISHRHEMVSSFIKNLGTFDMLSKFPKFDILKSINRLKNCAISDIIDDLFSIKKYCDQCNSLVTFLNKNCIDVEQLRLNLQCLEPFIGRIFAITFFYPFKQGVFDQDCSSSLKDILEQCTSRFDNKFTCYYCYTQKMIILEIRNENVNFEHCLVKVYKNKKLITTPYLTRQSEKFNCILNELLKSINEEIYELRNTLTDTSFIEKLLSVREEVTFLESINVFAHCSNRYNLTKPLIHDDQSISLKGIFALRLISGAETVMNDFDNYGTTIIRGENSSGKSVLSMSVGLVILMAQAGMYVPVQNGCNLPIFKSVMMVKDVHDSVFSNKSTFTNHIIDVSHCVNFVDMNPCENHFVYFDELCSYTNNEGGKHVFEKIVNFLFGKCTCVITTHFNIEEKKDVSFLYGNNTFQFSTRKSYMKKGYEHFMSD